MPATATGVHHRTYRSDLALRHTRAERARLLVVVLALAVLPFVVDVYWLSVVNTILIAVVGSVGLNILVGFTGQISLGQGGFLAVGAFTSALLYERAGMPAPVSIAAAVLFTAVIGAFFGLPALRLKGLYLAIATLAAQTIILFVVRRWDWLTDGEGYLDIRPFQLFGVEFTGPMRELMWYVTLLTVATLAVLAARNLFRANLGRSFMAVRDHDIAAAAMGVNVTYTKVMAFAVSSGFVGLAGALTAHYNSTVSWERFTLEESILFLAMIIVGGLGSVAGSVYGAAFIILLSPLLLELTRALHDVAPWLSGHFPALEIAAFGLVIVLFLIFEPRGLDRIWQRVKDYVRFWSFRY